MAIFFEIILIFFCSIFVSLRIAKEEKEHNNRFVRTILVITFFIALYFLIQSLTVIGAHIYTAIISFGAIGLIFNKKPQSDNTEHEAKKRQHKHQGINRPTPEQKKSNVKFLDTNQPSKSKETLILSQKRPPKRNPLPNNTQLKNIAFNYTNSSGDYTYREVDVKKVDENYVFGYCHSRQQMRTFRLDRIEYDEVIIRDSGEVLNVYDWIVQLYPLPEEY